MQEEATLVESRLRDLNKARLQLERQAEGGEQQTADMEAQLSDRIASMPAHLQQKYAETQSEV